MDRTLLPEWFGTDSVLRFPLARPVPVYVGAMGPQMLEMAGRHADGVLPLLYPPERYVSARQHVLAGAANGGRDIDLPACFWVSLSDDAGTARAALAEKLAYYGPSISAPMLAAVGLRPQDFAPPPGWRTAGTGRRSSSTTGCWPSAWPAAPRTCWPAAGRCTGWGPATCRSARHSGRTR